jgi:hypothetical protein
MSQNFHRAEKAGREAIAERLSTTGGVGGRGRGLGEGAVVACEASPVIVLVGGGGGRLVAEKAHEASPLIVLVTA